MPFTYDETGALLIRDVGGDTFIGLTDTPAAYAGNASRMLAVNAAANAVIFGTDIYWIEATSRLGVGIITPDGTIHAHTATAGAVTAVAAADDLVVENSSGGGISILVPDADFGQLVFGSPSDNLGAQVAWNHDSDLMIVGTGKVGAELILRSDNVTEAVRIDSAQQVGINDQAPSRRLQVVDDSAVTTAIVPIVRIESQVSGGAGAAGHGPAYEFYGETTTTEDTSMAQIAARWSVATHASRRARYELRAAYIGTDVLCAVIEAPFTGSADGNSRGVGAVDLQGWRANVTDVASGNFAALLGGQGSEASGTRSAVLGGAQAKADKYGQQAYAAGSFSGVGVGNAQGSKYIARRDIATHTDTTWFSLFLDEAAAQMTIDASTGWSIEVSIVGITANAAEQWGYLLYGLVERDNAGNTTLAASGKIQTIFESDAAYDAQLIADDANEALEVQVRRNGGVDYSIRWVATIRTSECTH